MHPQVFGGSKACICAREHPTERGETAGVARSLSLPPLFPSVYRIRILRGVTACCSLFYDIKSHRRVVVASPSPFDKTTCFSSMVPSSPPSSSPSSSSLSLLATGSDKLDSRGEAAELGAGNVAAARGQIRGETKDVTVVGYPVHEQVTPTDSQIDSICIAYACPNTRCRSASRRSRRPRVLGTTDCVAGLSRIHAFSHTALAFSRWLFDRGLLGYCF